MKLTLCPVRYVSDDEMFEVFNVGVCYHISEIRPEIFTIIKREIFTSITLLLLVPCISHTVIVIR
jgi:hypothetical protein